MEYIVSDVEYLSDNVYELTGARVRERVTRCGDCPKFRADWSPTYCTLHNHLADASGFCSWSPEG